MSFLLSFPLWEKMYYNRKILITSLPLTIASMQSLLFRGAFHCSLPTYHNSISFILWFTFISFLHDYFPKLLELLVHKIRRNISNVFFIFLLSCISTLLYCFFLHLFSSFILLRIWIFSFDFFSFHSHSNIMQ